jgi:NAD(P)H dehydrogenase (quinone)
MVRKDDERAARIRATGVEVVPGDLLDIDSVRSAMEGMSAAYFVYPLISGLIEATAYFAQSAREAGLRSIVNLSRISARRKSKSHQARDHWISERVFDWSGVPVTHLRPTFFAQWLTYDYMRVRRDITENGLISLPFGNGRHAPIAAEDQGRVIAAIDRAIALFIALLPMAGHDGGIGSMPTQPPPPPLAPPRRRAPASDVLSWSSATP